MTEGERATLRGRHHEVRQMLTDGDHVTPYSVCYSCGHVWPCDTLLLLDALDAAEASLAELQRKLGMERDVICADVGELLRALGLHDGARPESPQQVFHKAIENVRVLRAENERLRTENREHVAFIEQVVETRQIPE
jgi:hypothetical protein